MDSDPRSQLSEAAGTKPRRARAGRLREGLETVLVAILIVLFTTTFAVQNSVIPSASMEDTLLIGDYLFVNKVAFAPADAGSPVAWLAQRAPAVGDVVVFKYPPSPDVDYIKRIVGVPGDVIELRDKQLYRNGREVDEPYKVHKHGPIHSRDTREGRRDNFGPVTVPAGHYFVLGDNRDYSADSRDWEFVPRDHVTGRAFVIFWSRELDPRRKRDESALERMLHAARALYEHTRWERIGRHVG